MLKKTLKITAIVIIIINLICIIYFLPNRSLNKIVSTTDIESITVTYFDPSITEVDPDAIPEVNRELSQEEISEFINDIDSAKYKNRIKVKITINRILIVYTSGTSTLIRLTSICYYNNQDEIISNKQIRLDNTFDEYFQ